MEVIGSCVDVRNAPTCSAVHDGVWLLTFAGHVGIVRRIPCEEVVLHCVLQRLVRRHVDRTDGARGEPAAAVGPTRLAQLGVQGAERAAVELAQLQVSEMGDQVHVDGRAVGLVRVGPDCRPDGGGATGSRYSPNVSFTGAT